MSVHLCVFDFVRVLPACVATLVRNLKSDAESLDSLIRLRDSKAFLLVLDVFSPLHVLLLMSDLADVLNVKLADLIDIAIVDVDDELGHFARVEVVLVYRHTTRARHATHADGLVKCPLEVCDWLRDKWKLRGNKNPLLASESAL